MQLFYTAAIKLLYRRRYEQLAAKLLRKYFSDQSYAMHWQSKENAKWRVSNYRAGHLLSSPTQSQTTLSNRWLN